MQARTAVLPLSVATLLLCTAIPVLYALRVVRRGRARFDRLGPAPGTPLVPGWAVEAFYWALQAPGRALARRGVDPDALTLLALAFSLGSLPLIASGRLVQGALCVAVGGALDALDGLVARLRGRASAAGAVLDSVTDRLSDSAPFAGLAVLYRGSTATLLIPIAALVASSLVSYARARADVHRLRLPAGPMRRPERIAYLVLSLLLAPLVPSLSFAPRVPFPIALGGVAFIAVAGFLGAFLLVARTRAALAPSPPHAEPSPADSSRRSTETPPRAEPSRPSAASPPPLGRAAP